MVLLVDPASEDECQINGSTPTEHNDVTWTCHAHAMDMPESKRKKKQDKRKQTATGRRVSRVSNMWEWNRGVCKVGWGERQGSGPEAPLLTESNADPLKRPTVSRSTLHTSSGLANLMNHF